jgi:hypothetical protein
MGGFALAIRLSHLRRTMAMMGEGVGVLPWSHRLLVSGVCVSGDDEMTPYLLVTLRQDLGRAKTLCRG